MSLRLFSWALSLKALSSPEKFVLLAMAESADDDNIWQGTFEGISRFTNLNTDEIRAIRTSLYGRGILLDRGVNTVISAPKYDPTFVRAPSYKKKPISKTTRLLVMRRDNHQCQECGAEDDLTLDHIHPESKGGTNDIENLRVLCRMCNCRKGVKVAA